MLGCANPSSVDGFPFVSLFTGEVFRRSPLTEASSFQLSCSMSPWPSSSAPPPGPLGPAMLPPGHPRLSVRPAAEAAAPAVLAWSLGQCHMRPQGAATGSCGCGPALHRRLPAEPQLESLPCMCAQQQPPVAMEATIGYSPRMKMTYLRKSHWFVISWLFLCLISVLHRSSCVRFMSMHSTYGANVFHVIYFLYIVKY